MNSSSLVPSPSSAIVDWIDERLIAETQAVWNPYCGRELTKAEAIEILRTIARLADHLKDASS